MTVSIPHQLRVTALPARTFRPHRYRPAGHGTWSGHLPFAADLIAALKPSLFVELGTHYGESYFGMCQAVQENAICCQCYAVDTWRGDKHATFYDEAVFDEVTQYNERQYASFSTLLRMTFDEALQGFGDGTIDLLHIDGLHTYEAVRHDFESWMPKVRPGGIVLLHDTAARHQDLGVWRLWEELSDHYAHFEFRHDWGLGVLRKPGGPVSDSELLETILAGSPSERDFLRHYYAALAEALERADLIRRVPIRSPQATFQVFPGLAEGYQEASSVLSTIALNAWQQVVLELPEGSGEAPVRVDPADRPCLIEIEGIWLKRAVDGTTLRSWTNPEQLLALSPMADLIRLPDPTSTRFLSTGTDPSFSLPPVDPMLTNQRLVFETRIRIGEEVSAAIALLESAWAARRNATVADHEPTGERDSVRMERDVILARNHQLTAEIRNLQTERLAMAADYRRVHSLNDSLFNETVSLNARLAAVEERSKREVDALQAALDVIYRSKSWLLTAPLRALRRTIR